MQAWNKNVLRLQAGVLSLFWQLEKDIFLSSVKTLSHLQHDNIELHDNLPRMTRHRWVGSVFRNIAIFGKSFEQIHCRTPPVKRECAVSKKHINNRCWQRFPDFGLMKMSLVHFSLLGCGWGEVLSAAVQEPLNVLQRNYLWHFYAN